MELSYEEVVSLLVEWGCGGQSFLLPFHSSKSFFVTTLESTCVFPSLGGCRGSFSIAKMFDVHFVHFVVFLVVTILASMLGYSH